MGLRVRGAGLKVFMVSIDDLVCQLCIGCSLSLSNNGTKLCVITDIFGLSYFLTGTTCLGQKYHLEWDFLMRPAQTDTTLLKSTSQKIDVVSQPGACSKSKDLGRVPKVVIESQIT